MFLSSLRQPEGTPSQSPRVPPQQLGVESGQRPEQGKPCGGMRDWNQSWKRSCYLLMCYFRNLFEGNLYNIKIFPDNFVHRTSPRKNNNKILKPVTSTSTKKGENHGDSKISSLPKKVEMYHPLIWHVDVFPCKKWAISGISPINQEQLLKINHQKWILEKRIKMWSKKKELISMIWILAKKGGKKTLLYDPWKGSIDGATPRSWPLRIFDTEEVGSGLASHLLSPHISQHFTQEKLNNAKSLGVQKGGSTPPKTNGYQKWGFWKGILGIYMREN